MTAYGFAANGPLSLYVEISRVAIGGEVAETAEEIGRNFSLEKNALPKKHGFPQLKVFNFRITCGLPQGSSLHIEAVSQLVLAPKIFLLF